MFFATHFKLTHIWKGWTIFFLLKLNYFKISKSSNIVKTWNSMFTSIWQRKITLVSFISNINSRIVSRFTLKKLRSISLEEKLYFLPSKYNRCFQFTLYHIFVLDSEHIIQIFSYVTDDGSMIMETKFAFAYFIIFSLCIIGFSLVKKKNN